MLQTDTGLMSGRMRRLLKDRVYDVTNFLAAVLVDKRSAKLHKSKQKHKNKAITSYENKGVE